MQLNLQEGQAFVDPFTGEEAFAVAPITNCPHALQLDLKKTEEQVKSEKQDFFWKKCVDCTNSGENWICMVCNGIFCSRYIQGHMASHNLQNPDHFIALSFSDLSFWCYTCDSYITNNDLQKMRLLFQKVKFNEGDFNNNENGQQGLNLDILKNKINNCNGFFVCEDANASKAYQTLILEQFPKDIIVQKGVLKGYGNHHDKNKKNSLVKNDKEEIVGSVIRFNKGVDPTIREKISFLMNEIQGFPLSSHVSFEKVQIGDEFLETAVYYMKD